MKKYFELLRKSALFEGFSFEDLSAILGCLSARKKQYAKNAAVFLYGDAVRDIGVVLSGGVRIEREDLLGNRSILALSAPGGLFAEAFACAPAQKLPVAVTAVAESELLFIDCRRVLTPCSVACGFHTRLISNLMAILAQKNILLNEKIVVMSGRSTRDKLLTYLGGEAVKADSMSFVIPFNRQELADYLCVDRSAMSAELGRLRDEGMLDFDKSSFVLHAHPHE